MELALNILWLVIAIALVALWQARWHGRTTTRRSWNNAESVALLCALMLLFPVISLTDDLHDEIIMVEEASISKRALTSHDGTQLNGALGKVLDRFSVAALPHILQAPPLFFATVVTQEEAPAPRWASHTFGDRSPPARSL